MIYITPFEAKLREMSKKKEPKVQEVPNMANDDFMLYKESINTIEKGTLYGEAFDVKGVGQALSTTVAKILDAAGFIPAMYAKILTVNAMTECDIDKLETDIDAMVNTLNLGKTIGLADITAVYLRTYGGDVYSGNGVMAKGDYDKAMNKIVMEN